MKFNFSTFDYKASYAPEAYTPAQIINRIEEAVETDRRSPRVKYPRVVCYWPEILREYWDSYNREEARYRKGHPTNKQISEADEVTEWLSTKNGYLNVYESRLVWLRCAGFTWPKLRRVFRYSDDKMRKDFEGAILKLWAKLWRQHANGEYRKYGIRAIRR